MYSYDLLHPHHFPILSLNPNTFPFLIFFYLPHLIYSISYLIFPSTSSFDFLLRISPSHLLPIIFSLHLFPLLTSYPLLRSLFPSFLSTLYAYSLPDLTPRPHAPSSRPDLTPRPLILVARRTSGRWVSLPSNSPRENLPTATCTR